MPIAAWTVVGAVLLAAAIAAARWTHHYMRVVEPTAVEVTRHEVVSVDLPPALDGMSICQVSDAHLSDPPRNADALAEAIRSVRADLYVLTGDMVYGQAGIAAFFRWLDALGDAVRPAVAVLGNAEHKRHVHTSEVVAGLEARGVPLLVNACMDFAFGGDSLQIVGTDDPHTERADVELAYAKAAPDRWTLLLAHSPDVVVDLGGRRADLVLCGHTHGGQVRVPMLGTAFNNTRRVKGLVAGWYEGEELVRLARRRVATVRVYVSRGLGTTRLPYRLCSRPELPVFTLRGAPAAHGGGGRPGDRTGPSPA
ncbi:MAG: metallophosphoesterase [Chthonomonadales bacterium]|nr:metallophosphoesterase [Chthonomonadales bacterium]